MRRAGAVQEVSIALALLLLDQPSLNSILTCALTFVGGGSLWADDLLLRSGEDYYAVNTDSGFNIAVSIAPQYPPGQCEWLPALVDDLA